MPTLSNPEPHSHRRMAESFGVDAERYDRARPAYPAELIEKVVALMPRHDVLDVGCGTGIAARQFRTAGCAVLGVEPDARMADFARRDGLDVEVATFEEWQPAGRMFDAVVAGQSWHWVDPVAGARKAAEVLRPGGRFAAFAHVYDPPAEVAEALRQAYERVVPDSPFRRQSSGDAATPRSAVEGYQTMFASFADGLRKSGGFTDPGQWRFDWERRYSRDEWLDLLPTTGALTGLAPDAMAEVSREVGTAIDKLGGGFTLQYVTLAVSAARIDAPAVA